MPVRSHGRASAAERRQRVEQRPRPRTESPPARAASSEQLIVPPASGSGDKRRTCRRRGRAPSVAERWSPSTTRRGAHELGRARPRVADGSRSSCRWRDCRRGWGAPCSTGELDESCATAVEDATRHSRQSRQGGARSSARELSRSLARRAQVGPSPRGASTGTAPLGVHYPSARPAADRLRLRLQLLHRRSRSFTSASLLDPRLHVRLRSPHAPPLLESERRSSSSRARSSSSRSAGRSAGPQPSNVAFALAHRATRARQRSAHRGATGANRALARQRAVGVDATLATGASRPGGRPCWRRLQAGRRASTRGTN